MHAAKVTKIIPFPGKSRPCRKLKITDETIITFPFSKEECDIINRHLRERSPEICADIEDVGLRDVIERFMEYVWREVRTSAWAPTDAATIAELLLTLRTTRTISNKP